MDKHAASLSELRSANPLARAWLPDRYCSDIQNPSAEAANPFGNPSRVRNSFFDFARHQGSCGPREKGRAPPAPPAPTKRTGRSESVVRGALEAIGRKGEAGRPVTPILHPKPSSPCRIETRLMAMAPAHQLTLPEALELWRKRGERQLG